MKEKDISEQQRNHVKVENSLEIVNTQKNTGFYNTVITFVSQLYLEQKDYSIIKIITIASKIITTATFQDIDNKIIYKQKKPKN